MQKIELKIGKLPRPSTEVFECMWVLVYILLYENAESAFLFGSRIDEFLFCSGSWIINKRLFGEIQLKIFNNYRKTN